MQFYFLSTFMHTGYPVYFLDHNYACVTCIASDETTHSCCDLPKTLWFEKHKTATAHAHDTWSPCIAWLLALLYDRAALCVNHWGIMCKTIICIFLTPSSAHSASTWQVPQTSTVWFYCRAVYYKCHISLEIVGRVTPKYNRQLNVA